MIYKGRVYVLDYNESLNSDALRCFSLESGKELWRRWYRVPMKRNHGFSRTVPVIRDEYDNDRSSRACNVLRSGDW